MKGALSFGSSFLTAEVLIAVGVILDGATSWICGYSPMPIISRLPLSRSADIDFAVPTQKRRLDPKFTADDREKTKKA